MGLELGLQHPLKKTKHENVTAGNKHTSHLKEWFLWVQVNAHLETT